MNCSQWVRKFATISLSEHMKMKVQSQNFTKVLLNKSHVQCD